MATCQRGAKCKSHPLVLHPSTIPTDIISSGRLLSAVPEETLNSVGSKYGSYSRRRIGSQLQTDPTPPQPSQGSSTPSILSPSTGSHQTNAPLTHPTAQAPSSPPIALQEVNPDHGPISGGEKILLVGRGFSEGQDLLVRFGDGTTPVRTDLVNPYLLRCTLPPSDSAGRVSVTLHWQDSNRLDIQNEKNVIFTYEGVDKEMSV